MRKHKKILYISGIISLLFIAPLFWYFSKPTLEKMNLRVMDIGLPYKVKKEERVPEYSQIPMEGWNYKPINIPVNFDKETEKKFIALVNKLQNDKIEKNGIKFQFSNQNSYGDFVKLLNIMLKTKQEFYGIDLDKTNSMYVLYMTPNLQTNYYGDDVVYVDMDTYYYDRSSFFEKLINYSPKGIYYIIFGFLILIYSSILKPKLTINL